MSFVIKTGNKQYLVKNGQIVIVDRLNVDINSTIELPVLHATGDSKAVKTIKATVLNHQKGEKIRVVKYKAKSNYHKQYGFRAAETVLKIEGVFENKETQKSTTTTKATKTTTSTKSKTTAKAKTAQATTTKPKATKKVTN